MRYYRVGWVKIVIKYIFIDWVLVIVDINSSGYLWLVIVTLNTWSLRRLIMTPPTEETIKAVTVHVIIAVSSVTSVTDTQLR